MLYLHFGDRDALLVAAAADLVERELAPRAAKDLHAQVCLWWPDTWPSTGRSTARC